MHAISPAHLILLNSIWRGLKIKKFFAEQFSSTFCPFLQPPVTSFNLLSLPSNSCPFLQPLVTSFNLLSLPSTSCPFLQPPVTSFNLLSLPSTSCQFLQPPVPSFNLLSLPSTSRHFLHVGWASAQKWVFSSTPWPFYFPGKSFRLNRRLDGLHSLVT
jgi:hypothetical protein